MEENQRLREGGKADWMSCLPEELLDVPLWNLAIPGSHDSMSFCLDISSPILQSEPRLLQVIDRLLPCCTRPCIYRWATTQQSVLSDQCDLGIRYLDLRIAKKSDRGLFFAHGIYTLMNVEEALIELAFWLDAHPKEILLICCSHFDSLTDRDHSDLADYIITLFGKKLCSPQDTPTLRSCWSKGQKVIVFYDNQQVVLQDPEFWPGIPYWYADTTDPKKLISYLEEQQSRGRPPGFFASGLNLTEDTSYVLLHPFQNMRKMTMKNLSLLLCWASEQRPGSEVGRVNIMCCDFVAASQFCSLVIGLNYKLLQEVNGH
ncbi:hypothetical protein LDENG_00032840 [Lucifuga dentata]|nr:hypothetical protein LDENG_00032840 [Lucifuga dentata]